MKVSTLCSRLILPLSLLISLPELRGQVGNNNPTGTGGMFNGNVTTGCSYDPYTANAMRSVSDMVVAGAVGSYGLSYSRTWNTRNPGGWQNSYDWSIDDAIAVRDGDPIPYVVHFPDGRVETFGPLGQQGGIWRTTAGVRERLKPWDGANCYLLLPDGGKVKFQVTWDTYIDNGIRYYDFYFTALGIIDPYGLFTTFSYNGDGSFQITEPAGRWIKFFYTPGSNIDYIQGSDGREVHYTYQVVTFGTIPYTVLTSVVYYGDSSLTATYTYRSPNVGDVNGYPLLATCDDPMYAGPMKKILYTYAVADNLDGSHAVYAQLDSEKSSYGDAVSNLAITPNNTRIETRADGRQRTFTYNGSGYLIGWTDFRNVSTSQTYDSAMYVASVTDGRGNTTNFTNNPLTGAVTQIQYPLTLGAMAPDTAGRGTVTYTYGGDASCHDPNNVDANNPYYLCSVTDEALNVTQLTRDGNKRVTRIDYPDGAFETFTPYNSFGQVLSHQLKTGGTETFTYNGSVMQEYRNPDNASGNPTARYQYDALGRVSGVTDVFGTSVGDVNHTTNYDYNARGQLTLTTLPIDPIDNTRHTVVNTYNPNGDGTLVSVMDQLGHTTSYTSDEYRRLRSMTTPLRFAGDSTARTTWFSYDANQGNVEDYKHTDANVTLLTLPSTNIVKTTYDENYRKSFVTASAGSGAEPATTSYLYDNVGNVTSVLIPDEQPNQINSGRSTTSVYDQRNRLKSVTDPMTHLTTFIYDGGGRKWRVTQPNGQTITYNKYDPMNRLLQQTATQTPEPDAVTKYTYYPSGLLQTMQDPHLFNSTYSYSYNYDPMGRKTSVTYPPDAPGNGQYSESFVYDIAGRLHTYTTRASQVQTFTYDALHRQTGFSWAPKGTSNVAYGYDAANRVTSITSSTAAISRTYFDDNLLKTETETPTGVSANTVTYAYLADGNRDSILYPSLKKYRYNYTGRNQLKEVQDNNTFLYQAEYVYDVNGNMITRSVGNGLPAVGVTDASQRDPLGRVTHLEHLFAGPPRTFDYLYDAMSNRTSAQRDGGTPADTYGYDAAQQLTSTVLGGASTTLGYDANGNRTSLNGGGTYTTNNLNQFTSFNGFGVTYDANGNLATYNGWTYIYNAQNQLTTVQYGGTTVATYWYDGLHRQIRQTLNGGSPTFNVWDGWNLIEERGTGNTLQNAYVYGAGEIVEKITGTTPYFYYQDGSGSTSHLSDAAGNLLESYTYSGFGQPTFYDANGAPRIPNTSAYGVRHLFQGQLWTQQTGLNDHRNRMALPIMGVFLQPDPIGFGGDPSNLYRYCGNNAVNRRDSFGLDDDKPDGPPTPHYVDRNTGSGDGWDANDANQAASNAVDNTPGGESGYGRSGNTEVRIGDPVGVPGGTGSGPFNGGVPGGLNNSATGLTTGPGSNGPGGVRGDGGGRPGGGGNPYLASAPFIAEIGRGFDGPGLRELAGAFDNYARGVSVVVALPVAVPLSIELTASAWSAGVQTYTWAYVNAPIVVATVYGTTVIGTGTVNPGVAHEVLVEIIEFEIGHPGRGIPGRWP
jgi:RHS repeat-associated protein